MARKRSILFIAPLPPPVHGSAMVSDFIRKSSRLQEQFQCDFVDLSTSRRMDEIQKFSVRKIGRLIRIYVILLKKILTGRYDACCVLIACYGLPFLKDAPLVLLCKLFRKKVILYQHNKGMSRDVSKPFYRWLFRAVYRGTHVILLSWLLYPDVEQIVKREQVLICPNGFPELDTEPRGDKPRASISHLLFLSNLIESKGILVLLDACRILREKGLAFICDVIGGETREISASRFLEEIRVRGLSGNVVYHGKKYGHYKDVYFRNADLFVFPTYYPQECFPLTLLEAMQYGLPCVTSREGAIPEIVQNGKNGLLCEPKDSSSVARTIEALLGDPTKRLKMGREGRRLYCEHFTLQQFEINFLDCLLKIM